METYVKRTTATANRLRGESANLTRRALLKNALLVRALAGAAVGSSLSNFATGAPQETERQPSLSRQFARWAAALRYSDLPPTVVDRIKGLTLHNLASALLGARTPAGRQAVALVAEEAGVRSGGSILVEGTRVTIGGAAFANAEMVLAGGKWDTFRMLTHPGTSIIPAALVAAETAGGSGEELIVGLAAGYEVMERMAADFIPTVMARGFHAGPVFGIFGAAVAAAKIMRFNEDQIHNAIGLSVNLAGGNLESGGLREGAAVRNAMLAVALAKHGQRARESALEGNAGFYHAYAGNNYGQLTYSFVGQTKTRLDTIAANLGRQWMLLETLYRIYSVAGYNIAHVDVTAKLCEEHDITYQDVDRVEAVVNWLETQYPSPAFPTQREDIGEATVGSTRYYAAYGVVKRGFPILPGAPDPPEVLELMKRVRLIPSHEMGLFAPRITIFTKDGKNFTKQATGREFMWDFAEEVRRIRGVIPGLPIPAAQFEELVAACRNLEGLERANRLVQLTLAT
jgi:2-methylcitrate dehydratase PrpD